MNALIQMLNARAPDVLRTLGLMEMQIVLLALLVLTLERTLRQPLPKLRYTLWLVVLAKCLLPPLMPLPKAEQLPMAQKEAKMNRFTRKHTLLVTGMLVALLTVSWQCSRKPSVPTAPEQAKESDARPADFVEFDKAPTIIRDVAPKYPELAKAAGIEGEIWLQIFVREDGGVDKVEVFKSTKPEIGFEQAAIAAAQKFEFKPALKNGRPVVTWVVLPFKFKL